MATVSAVVVAVALAVVGRAFDLQVLNRDFLLDEADARHLRTVAIPAHRGMVTDRHGVPLAVSSPVFSAWAHPGELLEHRGRIPELAAVLERDPQELYRFLEQRAEREFVYLRRHMPPAMSERVRSLETPGVQLQRELRRFYPSGQVTAQLLGVTDIDGHGLEGVERTYNHLLRGESGAKRVLRDRLGRVVEDVELIREPRPGQDVALSIDRDIQYLAYRELKRAVRRHRAVAGSVVVLDVRTGEVLAAASQPSYNPHQRATMEPEARRNRVFANAYEPGSVIKPLTVAAALRSGALNATATFDTAPGTMRVGRHTVRDILDYGELDVTGIIQKSSNVGAAKIALLTEPRDLWQVFEDFGFGATTHVGLAGESAGYLDPAPPRGQVARATWSYGYGMSATPLQIARAYAALANDGMMYPVSLLRRDEPPSGHRVLEAQLAGEIRHMLEAVVEPGGTGLRARVPGYRVAGKTGTVRKAQAGGYREDAYVAMFAGYAPATRPRIAIAVVIDQPGGEFYYGGQVAAPVFAEVAAGALRVLNVRPDGHEERPTQSGRVLAAGGEQ
ncbi:peptidoglycan D,D-transpeptidase FtsI family protein [Halorhodospira abdelmalekii]|uniref:peptidoglycan D,D-transpeptidase FtsI family protein n=1 Tax=Halorhodospira abdelmalekii TaxID=421629 RepID=UPI001908C050|nr:penicillin-binding transpeptidase domain-containing protein [Halorhodospira abdelmalekii]